jgi:hypothetical protein
MGNQLRASYNCIANAQNDSDFARIRRLIARTCRVDIHTLFSFFPILQWLPTYNWRANLPADVVAGVTVAIMHVPQSMGYAMLARLPPVYGLYTSLWPSIIYPLLGMLLLMSTAIRTVIYIF